MTKTRRAVRGPVSLSTTTLSQVAGGISISPFYIAAASGTKIEQKQYYDVSVHDVIVTSVHPS